MKGVEVEWIFFISIASVACGESCVNSSGALKAGYVYRIAMTGSSIHRYGSNDAIIETPRPGEQ